MGTVGIYPIVMMSWLRLFPGRKVQTDTYWLMCFYLRRGIHDEGNKIFTTEGES